MGAKDTVMKESLKLTIEDDYRHELIASIHSRAKIKDLDQRLLETQAAITWKAREPEIEEARRAGRKEVVEWMKEYCPDVWNSFYRTPTFQIKLKELGL